MPCIRRLNLWRPASKLFLCDIQRPQFCARPILYSIVDRTNNHAVPLCECQANVFILTYLVTNKKKMRRFNGHWTADQVRLVSHRISEKQMVKIEKKTKAKTISKLSQKMIIKSGNRDESGRWGKLRCEGFMRNLSFDRGVEERGNTDDCKL